MNAKKINASIVIFHNKTSDLEKAINSILGSSLINKLYLVDNSKNDDLKLLKNINEEKIEYIFNNSNLGYGRAHNIAIRKSIEFNIDYHAVINPDIGFNDNLLDEISFVMDNNQNYGQIMPKITYQDGEIQFLCRLIPSPIDYICKRYIPFNWAKNISDKFMLKFTGYNKIMNVPILSGCFMFFRVSSLIDIGLFDERYFMYPEDDDITRRMHMKYKTIYYPLLTAIHGYEAAPYKSIRMHFILIFNMIKYFNKWGWIFDKERKAINKKTLTELNYYE